jgi:hypothetical protein
MSKLYPPILESTLPAFSSEIRIPFTLGLGTGWSDFDDVCILIKNGYSNDQIKVVTLDKDTNIETKDDGTYEIKIEVPSSIPTTSDLSFLSGKQGQYFKV